MIKKLLLQILFMMFSYYITSIIEFNSNTYRELFMYSLGSISMGILILLDPNYKIKN